MRDHHLFQLVIGNDEIIVFAHGQLHIFVLTRGAQADLALLFTDQEVQPLSCVSAKQLKHHFAKPSIHVSAYTCSLNDTDVLTIFVI
jgi:hypothetical protein